MVTNTAKEHDKLYTVKRSRGLVIFSGIHGTTMFNEFKIMPPSSIVSGFNESIDKL